MTLCYKIVFYQLTLSSVRAYRLHRVFSGDHIRKVIPVPIPNTEVKLSEPMIVHTSVKVGIAGFLKALVNIVNMGFFRFDITVV